MSERCAELSELEYALIMTSNAFNKWMVRCMAAAGEPDMGAFDVSLLHHVNHRDRKKKLADICFVLNVEDTHVVTYALKKLVKAGLRDERESGKELFFSTTEEGKALCMKYRDVRECVSDRNPRGERHCREVDWRDRAAVTHDLLPV